MGFTSPRAGEVNKVVGLHGVKIEVMQLAALLLEKTTEQLSEDEAAELVQSERRPSLRSPASESAARVLAAFDHRGLER
jgi:hypothetical protein